MFVFLRNAASGLYLMLEVALDFFYRENINDNILYCRYSKRLCEGSIDP